MNVLAARWALTTGAPTMARFVLVTLACHANRDGVAWPSVTTLADETGLARRSVITSLGVLEAAALVDVERSAGRGNRYRLPYTGSAGAAPVQELHQSSSRTRPVQLTTPTSAGAAPEGFRRMYEGGAREAVTVDNGSATFLPGSGWIAEHAPEPLDDVADPKRALRGARKAITRARRQNRDTRSD